MKKTIIFLWSMISLNALAQIEDWYKVDLSRVGYKHTKFQFEEAPTYSEWQKPADSLNTIKTIKGGSIELSVDIYTKHVYFSMDGSSLLDVGVTLFQFDKSKQRWWDNDNYYVLRSDILPTRLAFGTNITQYFGKEILETLISVVMFTVLAGT
jgi:hypothetical protein